MPKTRSLRYRWAGQRLTNSFSRIQRARVLAGIGRRRHAVRNPQKTRAAATTTKTRSRTVHKKKAANPKNNRTRTATKSWPVRERPNSRPSNPNQLRSILSWFVSTACPPNSLPPNQNTLQMVSRFGRFRPRMHIRQKPRAHLRIKRQRRHQDRLMSPARHLDPLLLSTR